MDLMADIGSADQLTSAREENKVLKSKVSELSAKVKELTLSCATLQAEVEIYRSEATLPSFSSLALGQQQQQQQQQDKSIESSSSTSNKKFISSGNGIYPTSPVVSLPNLHGPSNPLCCAIHPTLDTVLASGGADGILSLVTWGSAMAPTDTASADTVANAATIKCNAPVICVAVAKTDVVAAGCMDGSVTLVAYAMEPGGTMRARPLGNGQEIRHSKYVKFVLWSPDGTLLVTGSADGTVQFTSLSSSSSSFMPSTSTGDDEYMNDAEDTHQNDVLIHKVRTLHLAGPVEAGCLLDAGTRFCLYERGTHYLSYFDLKDDFKMTKQSLNGSVTGGFDEHVSFTVMHLCLSPDETCICAATDVSRNIVLQVLSKTATGDGAGTHDIIRDLYGHKNDGYSQPRVAWSKNGQYVFGTTQEDCNICVWDIASAAIVQRLGGTAADGTDGGMGVNIGHKGQIRDIYSSTVSDTLVSASFDKTVKVWLIDM